MEKAAPAAQEQPAHPEIVLQAFPSLPGGASAGAAPPEDEVDHSDSDNHSCVLKLKGLPYSADEAGIREFFGPQYNVRRLGVRTPRLAAAARRRYAPVVRSKE